MKINMQYIREYPNGQRKHMSPYEYQADRLNRKAYKQIHAFGSVIIYQMT